MWIKKEKVKGWLKEILGVGPDDIPSLITEIRSLVGPKEAVPKLKREIEELKLKKEMEERDIRHLVKLKQEKLEVEFQKKELKLKGEFKDKEMALQRDHHEKVMAQIEEGRKEMREIYDKIMERLPNVNMEMEVTRHTAKKDK